MGSSRKPWIGTNSIRSCWVVSDPLFLKSAQPTRRMEVSDTYLKGSHRLRFPGMKVHVLSALQEQEASMYVWKESTKLISGQPVKGVVRMRERECVWMASAQDHHLDPLSSSLTNILFTAAELSRYTVSHTR